MRAEKASPHGDFMHASPPKGPFNGVRGEMRTQNHARTAFRLYASHAMKSLTTRSALS